jgi:hypothetical protein
MVNPIINHIIILASHDPIRNPVRLDGSKSAWMVAPVVLDSWPGSWGLGFGRGFEACRQLVTWLGKSWGKDGKMLEKLRGNEGKWWDNVGKM